ncbi:probable hydrolase PNKD isoform X2 [Narcine bancroftii]|uniref:probable hydrolase PNKD isoform X2 n=1 Tax=Narcine bancroftii TaxID=1343680 RepID=UPI00383131C6
MLTWALGCALAVLAVGAIALLLLGLPGLGFRRWRVARCGQMARTEKPLFRIAYSLYTKTRLGYIFHKKQLKRTREHYPSGHSVVCPRIINGVKILPVPILSDNYSYLIVDVASNLAVAIDPADPEIIQACLEEEGATLEAILTTHKHWDHSGGNKVLKKIHKSCRVYGSSRDNIPALTNPILDKETIEVGNLRFQALFTPGHTVGHMIYVLDGTAHNSPASLFSGDLVFLSGCGRIFEGSSSLMLSSLDVVGTLENETLLWPGHEYAQDNLMFAASVEPNNPAIFTKLEWVLRQRHLSRCTCPSTIGEEKEYNPFLRTHSSNLHGALGIEQEPSEDLTLFRSRVLEEVRKRKDIFNCR